MLREAHDQVSSFYGSVWLGITGRSLSLPRARELQGQIDSEAKTYLYIAQMIKSGGAFKAFRSEIFQVATSFSDVKRELIPTYYGNEGILSEAKSWLRVGRFEPLDQSTFDDLRLAQSGKPVSNALRRSMLSVAFVCPG